MSFSLITQWPCNLEGKDDEIMSSEHLLKSGSLKHVYGDCRSGTLPMGACMLLPAKMGVFESGMA
jgi:hypothetical protein